jgi:SAM-dependent methyltransferase
LNRAAEPRVLDVGCGINKLPNAVGIDRNPVSRADVLVDINSLPYPFEDNSFDHVHCAHVIEHVADVMGTMEEFYRVLKPGGTVFIATPHYTDFSSFTDPTHRWHLSSYSFRYFGPDHGGFSYYSSAKFRETRVHVKLLMLWRYLGIEFVVNQWPRFRLFWEHYLCYIMRGKSIEWEFKTVKP